MSACAHRWEREPSGDARCAICNLYHWQMRIADVPNELVRLSPRPVEESALAELSALSADLRERVAVIEKALMIHFDFLAGKTRPTKAATDW